MQFKVPQDVQQADRIVAFLTLPQLIICVIGFAIAYGVYTALNSRGLTVVFWLPPVLIIGGLTISFAFLRIANLPFHQYLALLIERFITPSKRVWVKGSDRVIGEENYVSPEEKKQQELAKKTSAQQTEKEEKMEKIGEITDILDTLKKEPEPLAEIDQIPDEQLLQKAFLENEAKKESVPLPKKAEKPLEEKILEISSIPRPEQPMQKPLENAVKPSTAPATPVGLQAAVKPTNTVQNAVGEETTKKKRKRRRRKKRANSVPTGPTFPTVPNTPPLPSWLDEKPQPAKEPPKGETKPAEPKTPLQPQPVEAKKEPVPVDNNPPAPSVPSVPSVPSAPSLPAPEEHLALEEEYADAPIEPAPPQKTAQVSQSFSADDLKKGQTIKFPTP